MFLKVKLSKWRLEIEFADTFKKGTKLKKQIPEDAQTVQEEKHCQYNNQDV